jgi:hypothetical protein
MKPWQEPTQINETTWRTPPVGVLDKWAAGAVEAVDGRWIPVLYSVTSDGLTREELPDGSTEYSTTYTYAEIRLYSHTASKAPRSAVAYALRLALQRDKREITKRYTTRRK